MNINSEEFKDFQQFILSKSKARSEEQKILVKLNFLKFRMEDYLNAENSEEITVGEFLKAFLSALNNR